MTDYLQEAKYTIGISVGQNRIEMAKLYTQQAIAHALIALVETLQAQNGEKRCPCSTESNTPK